MGIPRLASAAPSDLDPSFGSGGVTTFPTFPPIPRFPPGTSNYLVSSRAIVVQQNGKILVAVEITRCGNGSQPMDLGCSPGYAAVVRYNADGSVDNGFGTNGVVTGPLSDVSELVAFLVQRDGKIVLVSGYVRNWVLRLNTDGTPDGTFGNQGMATLPTSPSAIAQQRDGKLLLATTVIAPDFSSGTSSVLRLNLDGSIDPTYGNKGLASLALPIFDVTPGFPQPVMAVQSDGKLIVAAAVRIFMPFFSPRGNFVERLNLDGTPDITFGDQGGVTSIAFTDTPLQLVALSAPLSIFFLDNGKFLMTGLQDAPADQVGQFALVQLTSDGKLDPTFSTGGRVIVAAAGSLGMASAVRQNDGKIVLAGSTPYPQIDVTGLVSTFLTRLNPDGTLDPEFGSCGTAQMPPVQSLTASPLALQGDGKLLFADDSVPVGSMFVPALMRLLGGESTAVYFGSGTNPAAFGVPVPLAATVFGASGSLIGPGQPTGTVTFNDGVAPIPGCMAVPVVASGAQVGMGFSFGASCQAQNLGLGAHVLSATYNGDTVNSPASSCPVTQFVDPAGVTTAVEFYHDVFDHYFITSFADEVGKLDGGFFRWRRTGEHFFVHPIDQLAGSSPVCRFFSGQSFAPKSSHFFTPIASECTAVMQNPGWLFEGTVFGLTLPDAQGGCGPGRVPLYRLYNNGQGGAPNHRYLTDLPLRDRMTRFFGWIPEGAGVGVIGCV